MAEWVRTDKWKPASSGGGSAGFSVECPANNGQLAHGKPTSVAQEILAYRLAQEVGVAVPETDLGTCNGATIAVSKMWGAQSMDVPTVNRVSPNDYNSEPFKQALRKASGLLAYHAWVGNSDLKDEHLMVRPGAAPNQYEIAAIDFASAFSWAAGQAASVALPGGPPALVANRDADTIEATTARIEQVADARLEAIVVALPETILSTADKERIWKGLATRKTAVRATLNGAGWLPAKT